MATQRHAWLSPQNLQRVAPPTEPRTKPAAQRRDELLDAAAVLVAAHGADKLTIDAVTTQAGMAKGTFYLSFATKDDVIQGLRNRMSEEFLAEHERSLAQLDPNDHAGRLDRWIFDAISGRVQRTELRDAVFCRHRAPGQIDTSVVAAGRNVAVLTDLLQAGVDAGDFAIEDVEATALLLFGAAHCGVDALIDHCGRDETARLVDATTRFARRGVGLGD